MIIKLLMVCIPLKILLNVQIDNLLELKLQRELIKKFKNNLLLQKNNKLVKSPLSSILK
jgi:hypothetical protein